ncbi:unnamed protein product [Adineta steineri]|uniref:Uncharacterized protein n=1 Tax=Adineta steineri TaxID=433720 RepID=A0A819H2X6_9BILA|nr:unnamed protein product [Adineta steineri]CAF3891981.1 unnamed protein product [Adineta steineri]
MTSKPPPNPSPYYQANIWSRFFHGWISILLRKCHKQGTLHSTDLYDLLSHLEATKLTERLEANWFDELKQTKRKPSLIRATIRAMGWKPFLTGLLLIPTDILKFAQPILLTFLMVFFESCSTIPTSHAWLLAAGISLAALISCTIYHQYFYEMNIYGAQMRIAYTGLLYRKILRLSSHSMNTLGSGQITNLVSNDASQVEKLLHFIHYIWAAPLEVIFMVIFFWQYVKYIAFIAIGYTIFLLIIQVFFGRLCVLLRTRILQVTDERIKIMSEIIKSMRIVKMYCWESAFDNKIRSIRKVEILQCAIRLILDSVQTLLSDTYITVTFLLMYGAMWSLGIHFDTRFFAVAACMLGYVRLTVLDYYYYAVRNLAYYLAAKKRIEAFLLLEESQRDNRLLSESVIDLSTSEHPTTENITKISNTNKPTKDKSHSVVCDLKQARWAQNSHFSLKNILFHAYPGDLICIIGPIGSGKSSLLQTLTGEIACFDGKVRLHGSFCYVPQEPWIFSSSIKTNILFGKQYNHKLFKRVINATALDTDFIELSHGANTLVGDQGVMLSGGQKARVNMARALYRDADIYLLDDPLSAVDVKVSKHLFDKSVKSYLRKKICILVTHQIQFLQDATKIVVLNNGEMVDMGTYEKLLHSSASFAHLLEDINQHNQKQEQEQELEDQMMMRRRVSTIISLCSEKEEDISSLPTNIETKEEGTVKWYVYVSYLRAGIGVCIGMLLIVVLFSAQQATSIYANWWLAEWSNDESHRHHVYTNCTNVVDEKTNKIRLMSETEWNVRRHNRFYTFCGRILNRFAKDIAIMDDSLPGTMFDLLQCLFQVLGTIALIGIFNPWVFISAIFVGSGMLFLRYRFARCLRDLKRIEGITRSPVYSHLTSTIQGLKVIRSYHAEKISSDEFLHHLDDNTRANYLLLTTNRWAAVRFEWLSCIFIILVTILAMVVHLVQQKFSAVGIALTLSYSLNLIGLLQWTIRLSVDVETEMTAVERVLEYCALDQEPPAQLPSNFTPPHNWPSHGQITFNNISMSHSKHSNIPLALDHISLTIQPTEKIGIVGRTGAGKSSFIQTLFRMGTLVDGNIVIDNIDIGTVGLDDIRRRISIIPQDPVLFTGTMRDNLDRFGDYSDAEIWHALEQVQLKTLVSDVMPNGLHSLVSESGSNLSVGQKQLVCLARAILKKSKILVIDEATANVDNATDELIQKSIREQFKKCTVLTVAHRLRTVIDSDRILLLGNGKVLEFDSPASLLCDVNSQFSLLVSQSGVGEDEYLRMLANIPKSNVQQTQEDDTFNKELLEDNTETDPLLPYIV